MKLILLLFSFSVFAQPSTSNSDLRHGKVIFHIEKVGDSAELLELRQSTLGYTLVHQLGESRELTRRLSGPKAQEIDSRFVSLFIKTKYAQKPKGKCSVNFKLVMRSEAFELCTEQRPQTQEIHAFLNQSISANGLKFQ